MRLFQKCLAEFIGTFAMVFAGTGALIVNEFSGGAITHVGIALTFGLVVLAMIYAVGDVSGAHLNPAVTLGFWGSRRFAASEVFPYIVSQLSGAILASAILHAVFPASMTLGATLPHVGTFFAFLFETILTFFLMFVIMQVATGSKEKGTLAGIAIGSTVALDALFGGPVTGASMNPARSIAPALISGNTDGLILIYILAQLLGVLLAVGAWKILSQRAC